MEPRWYIVLILCPQCERRCVIQSSAYSADGEFLFNFFCEECKEPVMWRVFGTQLINRAMARDLEERVISQIASPLKLPPPHLTEEDKQFEHDIGIDPEEKVC